MQVGSKVKVTRGEGSWLHKAVWWPATDITGTVTKVCKNGTVYVACEQIRNASEDGMHTKPFQKKDKVFFAVIE